MSDACEPPCYYCGSQTHAVQDCRSAKIKEVENLACQEYKQLVGKIVLVWQVSGYNIHRGEADCRAHRAGMFVKVCPTTDDKMFHWEKGVLHTHYNVEFGQHPPEGFQHFKDLFIEGSTYNSGGKLIDKADFGEIYEPYKPEKEKMNRPVKRQRIVSVETQKELDVCGSDKYTVFGGMDIKESIVNVEMHANNAMSPKTLISDAEIELLIARLKVAKEKVIEDADKYIALLQRLLLS